MAKSWFVYTGNNLLTSYYISTNYYKVDPTFSLGFTGNGTDLNYILASGSGSSNYPYSPLSIRMQWYIGAAILSGYAQPATIGKKYVYLGN